MFERYTERARRVLFFARYEASQIGSISIETEHLLLGLIREGKGLTSRIFARSHLYLENIRKEIESRSVLREKISTSVVGINVTQLKKQQVSPFFDPFWGGFFPYTRTFKVDNMGSGVLVSPDGYIINNTHVVDNAM